MLLEANCRTNTKSKYKCDRCKQEMNAREKYTIYLQKSYNTNPKKYVDFCINCMKAFERAKRKWESK